IPVGVTPPARQDTVADYVARSVAILGLSVPAFWLATLLIVLPAIWWGWRPVTGFVEVSRDPFNHVTQLLLAAVILGIATGPAVMRLTRRFEFPRDPSNNVTQLPLPAVILGIATGAALMRLTRGMLLEVLRQDYV